MKEKYVKPEIYSEDISTPFVGTCCQLQSTPLPTMGPYCNANCSPGGVYASA